MPLCRKNKTVIQIFVCSAAKLSYNHSHVAMQHFLSPPPISSGGFSPVFYKHGVFFGSFYQRAFLLKLQSRNAGIITP